MIRRDRMRVKSQIVGPGRCLIDFTGFIKCCKNVIISVVLFSLSKDFL